MNFQQILCRSLGNSNFIQPHVFLPAEFSGNERLRCGSDFLAPINLNPWVERDPFHKEGDFSSSNLVQSGSDVFFNEIPKTTARPIHIDSITDTPVLVTPRPTKKTTISGNIDFFTQSIKPTRRTTTTRRPSPTVINNKIDFDFEITTKRIVSPFSKLGKDSQKTLNATKIVKRSTTSKLLASKKKRKRPQDPVEHRSGDLTDITDETTTGKLFTNEDNATSYLNKKPIGPRRNETVKQTARLKTLMQNDNEIEKLAARPETRVNDNDEAVKPATSLETKASNDNEAPRLDTRGYYDKDYEYGDRPYRPSYDYSTYYPIYPPLTEPPNNRRPVAFQNNRPNYQNFNENRTPRPTNTPISNIHSTPFSYDSYLNDPKPMSSQINHAVPLYITHHLNKPGVRPTYDNFYRPTYPTTRRIDLTTFLYVETTRRTSLPSFIEYLDRRTTENPFSNTNLDADYPSYSSQSPSHVYRPISVSSIDNYDSDDDPTNLSYFVSSSNNNKFSTKYPTHENSQPFSSDLNPLSVFSHDETDSKDETESDDDDFDGYLRPDTSFYVPIKTEQKPSYNDYSNYNYKPEASTNAKFYYIKNVLHKSEGKSNEDDDTLYDQQQTPTKRYAELYDKHLTDKTPDDFRTMNDDAKLEGRSRHGSQNVFLVPFKLLTRIERPDNWVNTDTTSDQDKSTLPDVPTLRQDSLVANELPRPIFGKVKS